MAPVVDFDNDKVHFIPHNQNEIDQLINQPKPSDPIWAKQSIIFSTPHPCRGCVSSFIPLCVGWILLIAAGVTLVTLGSTEKHNGYYIAGSIILGVVVIVAIVLLSPILRYGLPCNFPIKPGPGYPFCIPDSTGTIVPMKTPNNQNSQIDLTNTSIYIIYNPTSPTANTQKLLDELVLPELKKKNIHSALLPTRWAGHAREYLKHLSFHDYSAVLLLGGDGSLFDSVNGMLAREDGLKLPIGLLPCGSGNSFSADLGTWEVEEALQRFINGYVQDCDVNHVRDYLSVLQEQNKLKDVADVSNKTPKSKTKRVAASSSSSTSKTPPTLAQVDDIDTSDFTYLGQYPLDVYSINTCSYGLIGDLAVGAERNRWLGTQRYQICGLWGVCKKGLFPTTVISRLDKYSSAEYTANPPKGIQKEEIRAETDSYLTAFSNITKFFGKGHFIAPKAYLNDGYADVTLAKATRRGELISIFNQIPSGSHVNQTHPTVSQYKTKEMALIAYKQQHSQGMFGGSKLSEEVRQFHDGLLAETTSFSTPKKPKTPKDKHSNIPNQDQIADHGSPLAPTEHSTQSQQHKASRSIQDYAVQIAEKWKNELAQSFITIDGEIYAFFGFLHINTIPSAFQVFVDPSSTSLQDAAAKFKE